MDSTLRVRTIRRDGYKCQARDTTGRKCNTPASEAAIIPGAEDPLTLCRWHYSRALAGESISARRPRSEHGR